MTHLAPQGRASRRRGAAASAPARQPAKQPAKQRTGKAARTGRAAGRTPSKTEGDPAAALDAQLRRDVGLYPTVTLELFSTAQPLYTRFLIIFGTCFSNVTVGYTTPGASCSGRRPRRTGGRCWPTSGPRRRHWAGIKPPGTPARACRRRSVVTGHYVIKRRFQSQRAHRYIRI